MGEILKRGTKDKPRFYVRYIDVDGVRRMQRAKGCTKQSEAKNLLTAIEKRVMEGKVGIERPTEEQIAKRAVTIREIGDKFTEVFTAPRIKNPEDYRMEARSVLTVRVYPTLADRPAATVTQLDVENLRDKLEAEGYAKQSVTNTLATLSKLYTWARKQQLIDCDNPCRGVERHHSESSEPIDPDKYLSRQEAAQLLAHAAEHAPDLHPMIAFCLLTGARKGEALGMTWSRIDFDRKQITIARSYDDKTKSSKPRHVPLHHELAPILRAWKERCPKTDAGLVFPVEGRMGESYETFGLADLMVAAGCHLPPKPWHSLRHSYASHLVMSGANILTVSKLLGHSDIETTMIYAHLAPDFMAAEVARVSFVLPMAGVTPITSAQTARMDTNQQQASTRIS